MAIYTTKKLSDTFLELPNADEGLYPLNHIFEPEYHQDIYRKPCDFTKDLPGSFRVGDTDNLRRSPNRGKQPKYADDKNDLETLIWEGMIKHDGTRVSKSEAGGNVCALNSSAIRFGYVDPGLARCVSSVFYTKNKNRSGVLKNDVLVNSTGDGTIGRVAVFPYDFPAVVDGHITILRFKDADLAWYVAAYLLSEDGQRQLYRYINGSSGQVEIYPQDIGRIWVKPAEVNHVKNIASRFRAACAAHDQFARDLRQSLSMI